MFKFVKKRQVKLQCNEVQKLNAKFYLRVHFIDLNIEHRQTNTKQAKKSLNCYIDKKLHIYKVVISVCISACMFNYAIITKKLICL